MSILYKHVTGATGASRRRLRRLAVLLVALVAVVAALIPATVGSASTPEGIASTFGGAGTTGGLFESPGGVAVNETGAGGAPAGAVYVADTTNDRIQEFTSSGTFIRAWGEGVVSAGDPSQADATQAVRVDATGGAYRLTFEGQATGEIAVAASAATVQADLEGLSTIGTGNVTVAGGPGNALGSTPYVVTFVGALKEKAEALMTVTVTSAFTGGLGGSGATANTATVATTNPGATGFDICEIAADCKAGTATATGGGMSKPVGVAVSQETGDVYVYDEGFASVDEFSAAGHFIRAWGAAVVSSGPDEADAEQALRISANVGLFTLSFGGQSTPEIQFDEPASKVQEDLEGLSSIGAHNVTVGGGPGSASGSAPYLVTFTGSLGGVAEALITVTNKSLSDSEGSLGATVASMHTGGKGFEICEAASGDVCKAGEDLIGAAKLGGGFDGSESANDLAVDPSTHDVVVGDLGNARVQEFTSTGHFILAFGQEVVSSGPDYATNFSFNVCVNASGDVCKAGNSSSGVVGGFESGGPTSIAVDSSGAIYATNKGEFQVEKFVPGATAASITPTVFASSQLTGTSATNAPTFLAVEPNAVTGNRVLVVKPTSTGSEDQVLELLANGEYVGAHYVGLGLPAASGLAYVPSSGGELYYPVATGNATIASSTVGVLSFAPDVVQAPAVSVSEAEGVTASSATLKGVVNPDGFETSYQLEYSANGSSWSKVPASPADAGDGTSNVPVSASVGGLSASTLYVVRITAQNAGGTSTSGQVSFETGALPPEVAQVIASPTQDGAVLSAYVNPNGSPTSYHFEYGTSTAYGQSAPEFERAIGSGGKAERVSEQISGLASSTPYYFRIVANNANAPGRTVRAAAFTTLSPTELPGGCANEQLRQESTVNPEAGVPFSTQLPDCRAYEMVTPELQNGAGMSAEDWTEGQSVGIVPSVSSDGSSVLVNTTGIWPALEGEQPPNNLAAETAATAAMRYRIVREATGWRYTPVDPKASEIVHVEPQYALSSDVELDGIWRGYEFSPSEGSASAPLLGDYATEGESLYRLESNGTLSLIGPMLPKAAVEKELFEAENASNPSSRSKDPYSEDVSQDLSHVLFGSNGTDFPYWPFDSTFNGSRANSIVPSLYEYAGINHTGEGSDVPSLVGVNNEGEQLTECGTHVGAETKTGELKANLHAHALSPNGTTVFFTAVGATGQDAEEDDTACHPGSPGVGPVTGLVFARVGEPGPGREVGEATTVNVAATGSGSPRKCSSDECGVSSPVTYQGASEDGSKVFFTTKQQLSTADKDTENNIWECRLPGDSGSPPARSGKVNPCPELVPVSVSGTASGANVQSIAAISEDGSHVYFIGTGALGGENAEGRSPVAGKDNLYVWEEPTAAHPQGHTAFIATLPTATLEEAKTTPDGRSLVFTSAGDLIPGDTSTVAQAFLYEAQNESLVRISCGQDGFNNNGNTTTDPVTIAGGGSENEATEENEQTEAGLSRKTISDDGSYVVFQSSDALTPQVHGGVNNVYEWHDGNVSLVSDGLPPNDTESAAVKRLGLIGIDSSGRNIFFVTAAKLVGQDGGTLEELYDARVEGGFPKPVQFAGCSGEACQGAPPAAALVSTLGSALGAEGNPSQPKTVSKPAVSKPKPLTRAQKLAKALKLCAKDRSKKKRAACEAQARRRYGAKAKGKHKAKAKKGTVRRTSGRGQ